MSEFDKPSRAEDEYFAKEELERRKKWAAEKAAQMAAEEKETLRKTHWMKCPKCGMDLAEIDLLGVKVDQCANCGGIFFDAGELDQLSKKDAGVLGKVFSIFR